MSSSATRARLLSGLLLTLCLSCNAALAQDAGPKAVYAILLDNTGSMRTQFRLVLTLGTDVVRHVHKEGPVALFSFETTGKKNEPLAVVRQESGWSQDERLLLSQINGLAVKTGQTAFFDALNSMAEAIDAKVALEKNPAARKFIVLITDGEDRASDLKEKELIKRLKEKNIQVYAVGLADALEPERGILRKGRRERAKESLEKIAKETGGRHVFPKADAAEVNSWLQGLSPAP